jgi:rare lipoprotein A
MTIEGVSSWYGEEFDGKQTSNGEIFDKNKMSAAHKDFPLGTWLRVTNLKNNRTIIVKVNDRGPFIEGRILDLSKKAADELGFLIEGLAKVRIEVLRWGTDINY